MRKLKKVASIPIFCCDELHLICCNCRPKVQMLAHTFDLNHFYCYLNYASFQVSACPECREVYPEKAKRHRYAEKAAEKLSGLQEERAKILESS